MTTGMPSHARTRSCTTRFSAAMIPSKRTRSRLTCANPCAACTAWAGGAPAMSAVWGGTSCSCIEPCAPSGGLGRLASLPYVIRGINTSMSRSVSARIESQGGEPIAARSADTPNPHVREYAPIRLSTLPWPDGPVAETRSSLGGNRTAVGADDASPERAATASSARNATVVRHWVTSTRASHTLGRSRSRFCNGGGDSTASEWGAGPSGGLGVGSGAGTFPPDAIALLIAPCAYAHNVKKFVTSTSKSERAPSVPRRLANASS